MKAMNNNTVTLFIEITTTINNIVQCLLTKKHMTTNTGTLLIDNEMHNKQFTIILT